MNDSPVDCQSRDLTEPAGETAVTDGGTPSVTEGLSASSKQALDCTTPPSRLGFTSAFHLPLHRGGIPASRGNLNILCRN